MLVLLSKVESQASAGQGQPGLRESGFNNAGHQTEDILWEKEYCSALAGVLLLVFQTF